MLSGLRAPGKAAPYAKGLAMQAAAGLNMDRAKQDQQLGVQQMQADSQDRLASARNNAERLGNDSRARMQAAGLASRKSIFDAGLKFDYAGLQKNNQLRWQQALLNYAAGDD